MKLIETQTNGTCFSSQKYSIDLDRPSTLIYENAERKVVVEKEGETERQTSTINLKDKASQITKDEPLFKYFLDGSRRVYKIDDISYANKVYPIITGQIGISCCKRENKRVSKQHFKRENIIVLPIDANADGNRHEQFFENIKNQINEKTEFLKKRGIQIGKILHYTPKKDTDSKGLAVAQIQDRMIELEKDSVAELVQTNLLNQYTYLIKDGTLEYKEYSSGKNADDRYKYAKIRNNYRYVVGVSKSFDPSLAKTKDKKSMAKIIADLDVFHRTPAIMCESSHTGQEKFSVWYLRIRTPYSSPFDGIIKIEKLLTHEDEKEKGLDTEVINSISANLINERNPVCYGNDTRWANHLYPIYLTELFAKSQYLSNTFFLNMF